MSLAGNLARVGVTSACHLLGPAGIALNPLLGMTAAWVGGHFKDGDLGKLAADAVGGVFGELAGGAAESTLAAVSAGGNFDLEAALADAFRVALDLAQEDARRQHVRLLSADFDDCFALWSQRLKGDPKSLFLRDAEIDPVALAQAADGEWWPVLRPVLARWLDEQQPGAVIPGPLESFLAQHLQGFVQDAFHHELRTGKHAKGWIAYQQRFLENIAAQVRGSNADVAEAIAALAPQFDRVFLEFAEVKELIRGRIQTTRPWNIPAATPTFTGRKWQLDAIRTHLAGGRAAAVVAVRGLGGVGKTQIALRYAEVHDAGYSAGWLLHAEQSTTLQADLASLASAAKLPEAGLRDQAETVAAVLRWLHDPVSAQNGKPWLLIFDNAENAASIAEYTNQIRVPYGHILITSRDPNWRRGATERVDVEEWPREDSVAFLLRRTDEADDKSADAIAAALGDLPLALEQAGGYVEATQSTLPAYARLLATRADDLMHLYPPTPDYPHPVATTWHLAFECLEERRPEAVRVLERAAWYAPDEMPFALFPELGGKDELARDQTVAALGCYSLAKVDKPGVLSLHRLVQAVVRARLRNAGRAGAVLEEALDAADAAFPFAWDRAETWEPSRALALHVVAVVDHAEAADVGLGQCGRLLNDVGQYFDSQVQLAEARTLTERALRIAEKVYGPDRPEVAIRASNLGLILKAEGDLAGARTLTERALRIAEKVYGPDDPEVAIYASNLGLILKAEGDLAGARTLAERALRIDEKLYRPDHPEIATDASNLATILKDQGDLAGARTRTQRALRIAERVYGPNHTQVAIYASNLGQILKAEGDLAAARTLTERALRIFERVHRADHPNVATLASNLGLILKAEGDLAGARILTDRALRIEESVKGPDHPNVAIYANNLGQILKAEGDLAGARTLTERALRIRTQFLGPDHPNTRIVADNLAAINAASE